MRKLLFILLLLPMIGYSQLELPYAIKVNNAIPLDYKYGPWASVAAAKSGIQQAIRYDGLTVMITGVGEYWWTSDLTDTGLIVKSGGSSYTFENMLTESGGTVVLDGAATQNTTLDGQFESYFFDVLDFYRFKVQSSDLQIITPGYGDWRIGGTSYDITGNGTTKKLTFNTTGAIDLTGRNNILIDNYAGASGAGDINITAFNDMVLSSYLGSLSVTTGDFMTFTSGGYINFDADSDMEFLANNGSMTINAADSLYIGALSNIHINPGADLRIKANGSDGTVGQVLTNLGNNGLVGWATITSATIESKIITSRDVTSASASVQSDNKRIIWLNSGSAFDFTLDQLTTNTVIDFVNIGAGTVTFINGTGVTLVGTATLVSGATATVIYRSTTSPYVIQ